ncbi:bacterial Ig-like domain-containing protein [Gracilibacillus sp. YIM 98692]|uniref:bacterial Ig-like domain-containing protein n=1 Tax=Gracilibacillus sp. YIM 98692 TaxID=2663532 RepID=UPI001F08D05C|nr:bacterial Ig-like domain-containing protein [Gracilibacillus sp. YIM 98692]
MKNHKRMLAILSIFVLLLSNIQVTALSANTEDAEMIDISSDWQGSIMGNVGGDNKITSENFGITENDDDSVTLKSINNRGKIESGSEGIAYYFKEVPTDTNYTISATAKVDSWDANSQVGFGIMLRSNVLDNENDSSFTGDYVAAGNIKQEMRGFYKYADEDFKHPEDLYTGPAPAVGEEYELSIQKSANFYTITIDGVEKTLEHTEDLNYAGLFTSRNTEVTFSDIKLDIEGQHNLSDLDFSVFGSNTGDDKNPDPTFHPDNSVTIEANGGKISSSVDGISYLHKDLPANANFELKTKATVHDFDGSDSQVSFGLMLRDEIGEHRDSSGHESTYVSVGALDKVMKGFYKQDSRQKLDAFANNSVPAADEVYDLTIKKSGDTYVVTSNGESESISAENLFTDEVYAGIFVARGATVTFSDFSIKVAKNVNGLSVDDSNMEKSEYLIGEELDVTGLEVTAEYDDGSTKVLSPSDYIVTGFDSSEAGTNTITINYNGITATVDVEIVPLTVTELQVKYYPAKTVYYKEESFDSQGLVITADYNNGYKTAELTDDLYTISISGQELQEDGYVFENAGTKTVTVTSTETPEETTTFNVEVKDADITGLDIRNQPTKQTYFLGDELDLSGMSVYATYSDSNDVQLMKGEYDVTGFDSTTVGEKEIKISYKGEEATLTVNVKEKELQNLEVTSYPQTTFTVGEAFNHNGLDVSKVYDSGDKELLDESSYTVDASAFDSTTAGTYDITIQPNNEDISPISYQVTVRDAVDYEWKEIRFGQSTSHDKNTITFLDDNTVELAAVGGAGKITGDHDGITFYYTEIDAQKDNFQLSADIKVKEYAKTPHDGQESFGIMARDAIGTDGDSSVFASNIAAVGGYSGGTKNDNGTQLFARTGVVSSDGEGSQGIQKKMLNNEKPTAENTESNYRLTLAKTNSGFTGQLNDGEEEIIFEPEILNVQDDKLYIGFYTARVATIEVSNIDFTVSAAQTDAPKVVPPEEPVSPSFDILSLDKTSDTDYTLLAKSNVDGTISVKEGQEVIVEEAHVTAGELFELPTSIHEEQDTNFSIVFLPDDTQFLTDYSKIVRNFTVTNKTYADADGNIYVSPEGTSAGAGSKDNPLDLDTAIEFVQKGQTIIVQEGTYVRNSPLHIKKYNDGTEDAMKYLIADPEAETRPVIDFDKKSAGVVHSGNYWHVKGIDFARSAGNTKGYTVGGDHNIIENIAAYEHGDTGIQISRTDGSDNIEDWPSYNLILNSISFDNRDPSENNADGFAAKLTTGVGNVFNGTIAHNNIDDGWDLYTKVGSGAIGPVTIENSIAYDNGFLTDGTVGSGDKNGFKLGGEGIHVPHVIKNSVAFGNGASGFTSNSNPGIIAENNYSFDNGGGNINFTTYSNIEEDFSIDNFVSFHTEANQSQDSYPSRLNADHNFMYDGSNTSNESGDQLTDELVETLTSITNVQRDEDGNILWGDIWDTFNAFMSQYETTQPDDEDGDSNSDQDEQENEDSNTDQGEQGNEDSNADQDEQGNEDSNADQDEQGNEDSNTDQDKQGNNGNNTGQADQDTVVTNPVVNNQEATVNNDDIHNIKQNGQIVLDLSNHNSSVNVQLTKDQVSTLKQKNATIDVQKQDVEMNVPAALLTNGEEAVEISFEKLSDIENMENALSAVYDFTINQGGKIISEFGDHTVTLTFTVDADQVNNPDNVSVYYWNPDTEIWEPVGGQYESGKIRVETSHFSTYTVFESTDDESQTDKPGTDAGTNDGSDLPDTATNAFNWLILGLLVLVTGACLLFMNKRKVKQ